MIHVTDYYGNTWLSFDFEIPPAVRHQLANFPVTITDDPHNGPIMLEKTNEKALGHLSAVFDNHLENRSKCYPKHVRFTEKTVLTEPLQLPESTTDEDLIAAAQKISDECLTPYAYRAIFNT
ncbi:hypothetical protein AHIS1_p002 [Acaryochloris phage A-HIS1]|nr:hypothetical protein AHIS1_p002 [Acaryochloris phage A-HIS1]